MGALLEHYAGALPLWLSPVQTVVIPIKTGFAEYVDLVKIRLTDNSIRFKLDDRNETLDKRIRQAELEKIPYILVIGEREAKSNTVAVRKRGEGDKGSKKLEEFIEQIRGEIDKKVS
jgi:threonyl-tRNA synthetase